MIEEHLSDIIKVQETHSQTEANDLLRQGWKLLNIYTTTFSYEPNDQATIYVLGKTDDR
ncbi:hypothetical protein [Clostridium sp. DJ247]|uniref:hypothetical protein n=1 Tax=Clostridium sp. DJ247 TaxID=2726188 RepID=UPI00162916DF|nr:hypothetical protein [Clostridium sp. DJ247]MBC2581824.1 hypothetical protein [Clostridium sp. DJ247]